MVDISRMHRVWTLLLVLPLCVLAEDQPAESAPRPEAPKKAPAKKKAAAPKAKAPKKKERFTLRYELAPGKRFIGSNTVSFDLKHKVRRGNKTEESRESSSAETLIQLAGPLCCGGRGLSGPGGGAGIGSIGIVVSGSSSKLAMNIPG